MISEASSGSLVRPDRSRAGLAQSLSRLGEWILAAAFLATPMTSLRAGGSVTVGDVLLAIAALLAVVLLLLRPKLPVSSRWIWGGAALIALSILLVQAFPPANLQVVDDAFRGPAFTSSLTTGARLLVALIVLPVAVSIVVSRWSAVTVLANAFVLGVSISCGVALLDAYAGTSIQTSLAANPDQVTLFLAGQPARFVGLTGHPNLLSMTVVLSLPLVLGRMTSVRTLLLNLPLCVLFLVAVLLSGSRAGLVGIAAVVVLSLLLNPRIRAAALSFDPKVIAGYAAAFVVTVLLVFVVPIQAGAGDGPASGSGGIAGLDRLESDDVSSQTSDSIRRQYLEDSVGFIADRPLLGYGFQFIETSHNIYLQLLLSGGVLALVGYLFVVFGYLREAFSLRSKLTGGRLDLLVALVVSILTYLIMGLVAPDLIDRYVYLPAALVLSMAALSALRPDPESATSEA